VGIAAVFLSKIFKEMFVKRLMISEIRASKVRMVTLKGCLRLTGRLHSLAGHSNLVPNKPQKALGVLGGRVESNLSTHRLRLNGRLKHTVQAPWVSNKERIRA
jgi:hypothetical protein